MVSASQLFKALADPTRLRILNLLFRGDLCVCDIVRVLRIGQSKASRHLACLRNSGLVTDRREGFWMHYCLAPAQGTLHQRVLQWLKEAGAEIPGSAADLRALQELRRRGELCPQLPASVRGQAPQTAQAQMR